MMERYRTPKIVAFGTAVAIGVSACSGESSSSDLATSAPTATHRYAGDDIAPKDISTCNGKLDGFRPGKDPYSKDGLIYEVTSINEGTCAVIYDLATLKGVGGLAVGDEFIGGCTFDDKPARIHVLAPNMVGDAGGDVNLTKAGSAQVGEADMPSCASEGTPDRGFFTPN